LGKAKEEEQFYWEHHSGKKAIRISFDKKRPHFFRHQYLWDTNA
jgi:hypothetical protein